MNSAGAAVLRFVHGPVASEDVVRVPETQWLIVSGLNIGQPARLFLIDARQMLAIPLPVAWQGASTGSQTLSDTDRPPNRASISMDGLSLRPGTGGRHTLLAANHGDRMAIEMFEVDARGDPPSARWIGCALLPPNMLPNAVRPLPEGGLLIICPYDPTRADAWDRMERGEETGRLVEWHAGRPVREVPNGGMSGGNGLELSADGQLVYCSAWSARRLIILSRHDGSREEISLDFMPDNIHRLDDGSLLIAGQRTTVQAIRACTATQCPQPWVVARVNPRNGDVLTLLEREGTADLNYACGALAVDGTLVITARGDQSVAYGSFAALPMIR